MRRRTLLTASALTLLTAGRAGAVTPAATAATAPDATTGPQPLAVPLHDINLIGALVVDGTLYGVTNGSPARMSAVDAATGETKFSSELPGASGSYTVVKGADGALYTGTNSNGHLYRVSPEDGAVTDLGQPLAGQTFLWDLAAAPDGRLFGCTYPGAGLFSYDPASGDVRDYGRVSDDTQQARAIAYADGSVFVGTMAPAHLFEVDPESGAISELDLPPDTADPAGLQVVDVNVVGGRLFLRMGTDIKHAPLYVLDLSTREWTGSLDGVAGLELPEPGPDGSIYVMVGNELVAWDPVSGKTSATGLVYPGRVYNYRGAGWVELDGQEWPGRTLTGWFWRGEIWRYNPQTGKSSITSDVNVPAEPVEVISLTTARDGTVLAGGFLAGIGRVRPADGAVTFFERFSQTERLLDDGTDVWIGAYPDARGYRWDPSATWSSPEYSPGPPGTPDNPVKTWDFIGDPDGQDRVLSLARAGRYLVSGTGPKGPTFGGQLAVYDTSAERVRKTATGLGDRAASSLAAIRRTVFVGTWIHGGTGAGEPPETEGTVFAYDPARDKVLWETRPVPGAATYAAMLATRDGRLWTVGDGTLAQLAPGNGRAVRRLRLGGFVDGGPWPAQVSILQPVPGQPALYVKAAGRLWWVWTGPLTAVDLGLADYNLFTALPNGDLVLGKGSQLYLSRLADHRPARPRR